MKQRQANMMNRVWAFALLGFLLVQDLQAEPYYPPLESVMDIDSLPSDGLTPVDDGSGTGIVDRIRVKEFVYSEVSVQEGATPEETRDVGAKIKAAFIIDNGFELAVPGLEEAFIIEVGQGSFSAEITMLGERLADLPPSVVPPEITHDLPFRVEIEIGTLPIDLVLNPEFFKPMTKSGNNYVESVSGDPARLRITVADGVKLVIQHDWDGQTDIFFADPDGPPQFPTVTLVDAAVQLGDTGVVIDIEDIVLDLSDSASPPGVTEGPTWKGVIIDKVAVAFTNGLEKQGGGENLSSKDPALAVSLTDFQIGTGGFSGTIAGTGLNLPIGLGGMDATLDSMSIQFTRNVLTGGGMGATIQEVPFFDGNAMAVNLALDMSGNLKIGLAAPPGSGGELVKLSVASVLDFHVQSAFFERRTDPELFLVGLNGKADLLFMQTGGDPPAVDVNGLTITSEGDVSLQGGWLTLSEKAGIDFNGFSVTLAQIGFGRTDPNSSTGTDPPQSWVGFTGGVKLVDGLGAEAEMQRMQFLWPKQGSGGLPSVDVKLDGIKVAFEQPNVVRFEGFVEWFESAPSDSGPAPEGFAGKLQLDLLALNMTMQSRIVVGKTMTPEEFAFFFLDMDMQLPTGIPLGSSGVSIYGFLGLLAYNMEPNLSPFESPVKWVNAFRTTNNIVVQQSGDPAATWAVRNGAMGIGAGVILGTTPDDGFAVNAKIALTIAVPGPVVMLTGQANVLKARTELSSNKPPLFVAVALYDGRESIFVINIGVFYELAKVVKISGEAEAFFDLDNPANWHIYLGQRDPESRRITAEILSLFKASSYYMIEPNGIGFGAKVTYGGRWKYGPLKVVLEAWMGFDAGASWRPIHTWAAVDVGGEIELSAFGVGVGLAARAELEMHAPKRYLLAGNMKVKLNLPWPLPDPKATVKLKWESHKNSRPEPLGEVVSAMTLHSRKEEWTFDPQQNTHTVPNDDPISWPGATIARSRLASPDDSIPAPGETLVPGAELPMVPLDTFASLRFEKRLNDVGPLGQGLGLGNAYNQGSPHTEVIDEKVIRYNAIDTTLAHGFKTPASPYTLTDEIDLLGNWPAIPFTQDEPADNTLDLLGKNGFRYYSNSTYLGYAEDGDGWKEWISGHYGLRYCLDNMDPRRQMKYWSQYHYSAFTNTQTPPAGSSDGDSTSTGGARSGAAVQIVAPQSVHNYPNQFDCPLDLDWLEGEDFVLPPYSVFQLTFEGDAHGATAAPRYRKYGNSIAFHTEGPPLALDDYVRVTVPEFSDRPYYRDYHVGLHFNENYMNKLYREAGQFFQLQVLDENEEPIVGTIGTNWDEAESFSLSESEIAWYGLMVALGAVDPSNIAKDDVVHAATDISGSIRPAERHIVRTWLEDPRLETDSRLGNTGENWRTRNGARYFDQSEKQAVLHEFSFIASRYNTFADVLKPFTDSGSTWFAMPVQADPNSSLASGDPLNQPFIEGNGAVSNADHATIGVFLRHLLSPSTPDEFTSRTLHDYVRRTPGYVDDITEFSTADAAAVGAVWNDALSVFEKLDAALATDRAKEPLPEQLEIYVLEHSDSRVGLLLEFPEAIDPSRLEVNWIDPQSGSDDLYMVPSPNNERLFLFLMGASGVRTLVDGVHNLRFEYHLKLSDQNPRYFSDSLGDTEAVTISLDIPSGEFQLESQP